MGMVMRMIKGMVSVWYRARQKRRLIKDTDSKIQNKIAFFVRFCTVIAHQNPGTQTVFVFVTISFAESNRTQSERQLY